MPFSTRQVRTALTSKHGFRPDPSGAHPDFTRWHDGQLIAVTHISHGSGGKEVSDRVVGMMARQLRVSAPTLRGAIDCTVGPQAFLEALLRGVTAQGRRAPETP
jgi:hypothetical protein